MMFGLLAASSLVGALAVAWPIYLHLRKDRRKQVQVVPSLRLFLGPSARPRRRKIREALLLAARAGVLIALALILSQPFLESFRDLPFPRLSSAIDDDLFLGVVIDDGLTAFHGEEGASRFERSRAWLLAQIDRLPESASLCFAAASYPRPTGFMDRARARSLVERMRPVPKDGDAGEALARLAEAFGERRGAIAATAPLERVLWPPAAGGRSSLRKVFFHDTTAGRTDPFILGVTREVRPAGGAAWACELAGSDESLSGKSIAVKDRKGKVVSRRAIALPEALARRAVLDAPAAGYRSSPFMGEERAGYEVSLEGPAAHPWRRYWIVAGGTPTSAAGGVVTFLEDGPEALLAARILDATVKAIRPELPRRFLASAVERTAETPPARAVIVVGTPPPENEGGAWLERQLEAGAQVLCIPTLATPAGGGPSAAASLRLPSWGHPADVPGAAFLPLRVDSARVPEGHRFDDLLLGELREIDAKGLRDPIHPGASWPVVLTAEGKTLLSVARPGGRSAIWALGLPISGEQDLVCHPFFPILVEWILFPAAAVAAESGPAATVGESVSAAAWFGAPTEGGKLFGPGGSPVPLPRGPAGSDWLPVSRAGVYELRGESGSRWAAANDPRPADAGVIERAAWREAEGVGEVVWLDDDGSVPIEELAESPLRPGSASSRYDLAAAAIALLLTFLVAEVGLLARCWWRRSGGP